VRLNNSLQPRGGHVVFVSRPLEGATEAFTPDRVVTARCTELVRLLMAELGAGERTERELLDRLVAAGLAPDAAARTLDQLVRVGLCHRGVGLPDQTVGAAGLLAAKLRALGTAQAVECAAILRRLQEIEDGYAAASAVRRTELLAELRGLLDRFVAVTGCPAPAQEAMRTAVYEDLGTRGRAASWDPALLERNREHIELFQRVVPVLDDAGIEKLGLYRFATEQAGVGPDGAPLVDLYCAFAELPADRAAAVMSAVGDPHAEAVRAARGRVFDLLRRGVAADPDAAELILDPRELAALVRSAPEVVPPWRSTAYRIQLDHCGPRPLVVVNGVTTGHGVFFSRFCDLLAPDGVGWNLGAAVRDHIAATSPRQTDITATLGLNFNLHPRLTPFELAYPGAVVRDGAEGVLTLADLTVRPDPVRRRLVLVSTVDGQPIDLVPLNFLYPAAAPMLYRFLCAFAPTRTYRGGLWEQMDRAGGAPGTGQRPRVLLGDLVLDRRSWRFPVARLPALDGLERQELGALAEFDRWRRTAGVPRTAFFRLLAAPPPQSQPPGPGEQGMLDEARRWALAARSARMHKPHFVDAHNPLLMHVLAKQARAAPGATVMFQECLPAADTYTAGTGLPSAEEFFVEYTIREQR
jgi:Lantibiotic dehydratase, N terminus